MGRQKGKGQLTEFNKQLRRGVEQTEMGALSFRQTTGKGEPRETNRWRKVDRHGLNGERWTDIWTNGKRWTDIWTKSVNGEMWTDRQMEKGGQADRRRKVCRQRQ